MTKSNPGGNEAAGEGPEPEPALKPGEWTAKAASSKTNQWLAYLNLGWLMVANMAVFTGIGLWADRHFGTAPVLLLIGVFLGFFGCGYTIYRAVKKIESEERPQPRS
jgi:F0F1-type ATP synthase assembly protein I